MSKNTKHKKKPKKKKSDLWSRKEELNRNRSQDDPDVGCSRQILESIYLTHTQKLKESRLLMSKQKILAQKKTKQL